MASPIVQTARFARLCITTLGWSRCAALAVRQVVGLNKAQRIFELREPRLCAALRFPSTDLEVWKKVVLDREYNPPFHHPVHSILDLGANIGLSALDFHQRFPTATIIAVEPDPENFALLQRNTAGIAAIIPVQAAAWTHDGTIQLSDPGIGAWGYQVSDQPSPETTRPVTAVSIPTLLARLPNQRCDLMKVDVEGAEKELFENSAGWIDQINAVAIELHDRFKPGCARAFFNAVSSFPHEHWNGENLWVWRKP